MNSTDPRPSANGGVRNGRMPSTRSPRRNPTSSSNQRNQQDDSVVVSPLHIRGRAATNTDARVAGSLGASSSYAYTFSSGNDNSNSNRFTTRPGRAENTADSNYRYEFYRDYQTSPSPSDADGRGGGRGGNGGRDGGRDGGKGGGRDGGRDGGGNNNNGHNQNGRDDDHRHNVSFSFNIHGSTGGAVPEVNIGGFGGGLFNGLPVALPMFGAGFPFGGRNESRPGFGNISPFGRF